MVTSRKTSYILREGIWEMWRKHIKKGDIVIVEFGDNITTEKRGIRPAVVLSNNVINNSSENIIVAPLTKSEHKQNGEGRTKLYPWQIHLSKNYYKKLEHSSIVQLEDVKSISKRYVKSHVSKLSKSNYREMNSKLKELFSL